jgi:uncharacterized protein YheU (UPF0270 family)
LVSLAVRQSERRPERAATPWKGGKKAGGVVGLGEELKPASGRKAGSAVGLSEELKVVYSIAGPGTFRSAGELARYLRLHGVDTGEWGTGSAREVADLLRELERGESVLAFSPRSVRRWVDVAKVNILRSDRDVFHLVEAYQLMPDGRMRPRGMPLSEKLLHKEPPLAAALRGLAEELGPLGEGDNVRVDASSLRQWRETRESRSYPTLVTCYNLHQFDAIVEALPNTRFHTSESEETGQVVHVWDWTPRPPPNANSYRDLAFIMW